MNKIRPIFKWAGGKFNCIERIVKSFPAANRLIEPFTGAATIFFNTQYPQYLLAEKNEDLVVFYKMLKCYKNSFMKECKVYFQPHFNQPDVYYQLRDEFNQSPMGRKRAALFLYLNRHGFNGLCRYNRSGIFNVPHGQYKRPFFPQLAMETFIDRQNQIELLCADFRETFSRAKPGDLIYCDPPYVPILKEQKAFAYHAVPFSLECQIELAELAQSSAKKGIPVIISNHDTPFTREHYAQADIHRFNVTRAISCRADQRNPVTEILAVFQPC